MELKMIFFLLLSMRIVGADYLAYTWYSNLNCTGSPSFFQPQGLPDACPETRERLKCINSTHYMVTRYTDSSCTSISSSYVESRYPVCNLKNDPLPLIVSCVAGVFEMPTTGCVLSSSLESSSSCSNAPDLITHYPVVESCFLTNQFAYQFGSEVRSGRITSDKTYIFFEGYSDTTCSNYLKTSTQLKGCDPSSGTIAYFYQPSSPSSPAKTAIIIGGAVGGTLAIVLLVGGGIYLMRMNRGTTKETVPLLSLACT